MKYLISIVVLLIISISCYAQEVQRSYTLLMLDFEDRSGIENPLLAMFNDAIDFGLSRQTGPVQVRLISKPLRDAFLARAATTQPNIPLVEQGLNAAELSGADALIAGSYTKQGDEWSLEAQVYHRREGGKMRQEIQIQGDSVYKLLDEFPAQLLKQFATGYVALTTNSWKAYEEFRKGHEAFAQYNFFVALEHYEKALKLDPTLALAYAEQSYVCFMSGRPDQATKSIEGAKQWYPKASPMEQIAIRILDYSWDEEKNSYKAGQGILDLAPGGVWDEILIHRTIADIYTGEGKQAEANYHHQQWFESVQQKIRANPEDALLLHSTASHCLDIKRYVDEAIDMELKATVELNLGEVYWISPRYVLSELYVLKGDMEQALKWEGQCIQHFPDHRPDISDSIGYFRPWNLLSNLLRDGKISPERLVQWCEDMLRVQGLYQAYRTRTQYSMAAAYNAMNDKAKVDAILTSIGAAHESDWMVLGPLVTSEEDPFPEVPPFALCENLEDTHSGIFDKEFRWESWNDGIPLDGKLSIAWSFNDRYYGRAGVHTPPGGIVYSCIYVEVPESVEAQVHTGSGMIRIWLNDNPSHMIESNIVRATIVDTEMNRVSLAAGLNRLLVATLTGTYGLSFTLRITGNDGNAIPGLKYISAKEVLSAR